MLIVQKIMDKSLIDYLKQIPDHRAPHGLRHPLWLVLLLIVMGMMSGYYGYRQLGRFVERQFRLRRATTSL